MRCAKGKSKEFNQIVFDENKNNSSASGEKSKKFRKLQKSWRRNIMQ